jgi:hypothetical protein
MWPPRHISPSRAFQPSVVTLHVGTNDMDRSVDPDNAPARLGALIDQIQTDSPQTTVLVATLVPSKDATVEQRIDTYNDGVVAQIEQRADAGKHVGLVDMAAVTTDDLADTLHPNDAGYDKMADAWNEAIAEANAAGWVKDTFDGALCNDTAGRWIPRGQIASGIPDIDSHEQLDFADIDGDKRDDYLLTNVKTGAVRAWLNRGGDHDGQPGWESRGQIASGVPGFDGDTQVVDFADIDGDGRDDYLIIDIESGAVQAWRNIGGDQNGQPGWIALGQIASGVDGVPRPVFADMDGDGRDDYLMADLTNGSVRAWLNRGGDHDGQPGWEPRGQIASGTLKAGDKLMFNNVDCDRRADYLTADPITGSVQAWLNRGGDQNGQPGWEPRGQITSGALKEGYGLKFADIDGDGRDDYLIYNATTGSVQAWINKGGDPA